MALAWADVSRCLSPALTAGWAKYARIMSLLADRSLPGHASRAARDHAPRGGIGPLALGALGVVYGNIGTSPLYAMDQIFRARPGAGA